MPALNSFLTLVEPRANTQPQHRTTKHSMANKTCLARLRKELRSFDPPPFIRAAPLESNLQEWRYVLQAPKITQCNAGVSESPLRSRATGWRLLLPGSSAPPTL
ncbi:hypothetical protein EMIHUDRAFT_250470 [Emiliania huxleyi CCMP1516]|uniref:UBC core domain-containing protein n=2 Tax=Emiliania huxleyi TaxID=2903 RepID=A0A0D3I048_EMIH1|nr:hypothetical protein EMIHUDRAFT_250470 [Emiliania huxleyi CCMP1516]EOD04633.1 hypothetical protein EMIHUDRAFT_250470 [Emiliania huxleyi CCMP1516]|eukprot:XP_005757062.1 hypothetical protein EMIHUDRAFT_250470 [Emiliania huxleyi CCMP1516]